MLAESLECCQAEIKMHYYPYMYVTCMLMLPMQPLQLEGKTMQRLGAAWDALWGGLGKGGSAIAKQSKTQEHELTFVEELEAALLGREDGCSQGKLVRGDSFGRASRQKRSSYNKVESRALRQELLDFKNEFVAEHSPQNGNPGEPVAPAAGAPTSLRRQLQDQNRHKRQRRQLRDEPHSDSCTTRACGDSCSVTP